ncbi:MAG: type II toxin-antitoxin system YafQ family toxin [Prevotella sp.]|jgi:mRNA interferase YafQ|nr:type II toxin-antitoxin system YafQ family toxin [Paludibacteraceae bacterium]MBP3573989.1 type II toxin-antitoxin system YafQ family toxin [Prevotella sp.]
MKYELIIASSFKRDYKKILKRKYDVTLLDDIVNKLQNGEELPEKNHDHALSGEWKGYRECHILPDWLLVYKISDEQLVLSLTRTGSHSDLNF